MLLYLNQLDLMVAKFIQEHAPISMHAASLFFKKTDSTIRRSITNINTFLNDHIEMRDGFITIDKKIIKTSFSYVHYLNLLKILTLKQYTTNAYERNTALIIALALNDHVNKNDFYKEFGVSATTIKNDRKLLLKMLAPYRITINTLAKQGTIISGYEHSLRIIMSLIIIKTLEVNISNELEIHLSNSPVNHWIAQYFLSKCAESIHEAHQLFQHIEQTMTAKLSYNSKKYCLVYLTLSLHKIKQNHLIQADQITPLLAATEYTFLPSAAENHFLNLLLCSMSYKEISFEIYDDLLCNIVMQFCENLQTDLVTIIHNHHTLFQTIYRFLYGALIQNQYGFFFEDKKLINVKTDHAHLYQLIKKHIGRLETTFNIVISQTHLATLTLIIKQFIIQNKTYDRNKKKIIIVTNASENKIGFFKETLRLNFHIDIVNIINSNELYLLNQQYDLIITFTNKISSLLKYKNLPFIKVDFNLKANDLERLRQCGLSRSRRKIPLNHFKSQIKDLSEAELTTFLANYYDDYFIS